AVALYLTTAFSFSSLQLWAPTRFAFVIALWERYQDWRSARAKQQMQRDLEKRRASKPMIATQLVPARPAPPPRVAEPVRTGIDRMAEDKEELPPPPPFEKPRALAHVAEPEVTERADTDSKAKTTL